MSQQNIETKQYFYFISAPPSPTSSRRSMVIRTILNQLPLSPQQVDKIKEELTPASQNLNENIRFIQNQMKNRGILEDIEPININSVNVESQTQNEREKSDYSNMSRPYSNNEFEDYESIDGNQSNDVNKCRDSNNENANKSSPELPPIEIYSESESNVKKDYSLSSRYTSPAKTFNNDNEYYEYEEFYHEEVENAKKKQNPFVESQCCYKNDKDQKQKEKTCAVHNKMPRENSLSPQAVHSCYQNSAKEKRCEVKRQALSSKGRGKYVVNCENCAPHSNTRKEAKGDSNAINKYECSSTDSEYTTQQTAFEFYEISSSETTIQENINKLGCCSNVNSMLRSIFTFQQAK